jgi:hypothetical protein
MNARRSLVSMLAFLLVGCTETVVLPVDEGLAHDEIVSRLKKLFEQELMTASDLVFARGAPEERISDTETRLTYRHMTPRPPPSLYTPAVAYDWTFIDIDTSQQGNVRISVRTYRRGNFIHDRQHEAESKIAAQLSVLKERANSALQRTPASGRR